MGMLSGLDNSFVFNSGWRLSFLSFRFDKPWSSGALSDDDASLSLDGAERFLCLSRSLISAIFFTYSSGGILT